MLHTQFTQFMIETFEVLLALTFFLTLVSGITPRASFQVPLISKYLLFSMTLVGVSIVSSVFVANIHHRTPQTHKFPPWCRHVFLTVRDPQTWTSKNLFPRTKRSLDLLWKFYLDICSWPDQKRTSQFSLMGIGSQLIWMQWRMQKWKAIHKFNLRLVAIMSRKSCHENFNRYQMWTFQKYPVSKMGLNCTQPQFRSGERILPWVRWWVNIENYSSCWSNDCRTDEQETFFIAGQSFKVTTS